MTRVSPEQSKCIVCKEIIKSNIKLSMANCPQSPSEKKKFITPERDDRTFFYIRFLSDNNSKIVFYRRDLIKRAQYYNEKEAAAEFV